MTCIAGIVSKNTVYIGGDSAGVSGDSIRRRKDVKVFELANGSMVLGFTTSFRMGQLLRYGFKVPLHPEDMDDMEYLCTKFVDAIRKRFKDGGWLERKNDMECGGTFLLGYRGKLFYVGSDFQVGESVDGYDAVGSGKEIAIGALAALANMDDITPEDKIIMSLEASEKFNSGVSSPFNIVKTKEKKASKKKRKKRR